MANIRKNIEPEDMEWFQGYLEERKWLLEGVELKEHMHQLSTQRWRSVRIAYKQRLNQRQIKSQLEQLYKLESKAKSTYTLHKKD